MKLDRRVGFMLIGNGFSPRWQQGGSAIVQDSKHHRYEKLFPFNSPEGHGYDRLRPPTNEDSTHLLYISFLFSFLF